MFEILQGIIDFIFAPIEGEYSCAFLGYAALVLAAISTGYKIYKGETQEEPFDVTPPLSARQLGGAAKIDLSDVGRIQPQVPRDSQSGLNFASAMQSPMFAPMRLGDVLREDKEQLPERFPRRRF